ncbi:MAG: MFS transporter [Candidatus Lokiarchaeota archaeon]|nr:MFS transporter [Candidatus Lokiarchaeota archaeon]
MVDETARNCHDVHLQDAEDVRKKTRTMRLSIVEGCFGIGSNTVNDNFLVPFALGIGASPFQVGILSALPGLVAPAGQVAGSHAMYTRTRGGIILQGIGGMTIAAAIMLVMAITAMNSTGTWGFLAWFLLAFWSIYQFCGGFMSPAWISNMGDIVPQDRRGRYFGKRNLITTLTSMLMALALSAWLQDYKNRGLLMLGFVALFSFGFGTRFISWILFWFHHYPSLTITKENHVTLRQFARDLHKTNFGQFTLLVMLITFGQSIGGTFFSVYMLSPVTAGGLGFDYITYSLMAVVNWTVALVTFPLAGKFGDKHGNVRLMRLGAVIIPTLPIMWIFTKTAIDVAIWPQLWGGIGWTTFNLATSNFIYDNVPVQKRGAYVAYYTLVVGMGQIAGGLLGSTLVAAFPPTTFGSGSYLLLFLLSGAARAIFVAIYLPRIKEINQKAKPILNMKPGNAFKVANEILLREGRKSGNDTNGTNGNDGDGSCKDDGGKDGRNNRSSSDAGGHAATKHDDL